MAKLFGRAFITIDGQLLETEVGASIDIGGVKREPKPGTHAADGYTESLQPARIECKVRVDEDTSLEALNFAEATVLFELDTGQQYLVEGAYTLDPPKATAGEGYAELAIGGDSALEVR
jgi:hypothetical protein